MASLKLSHRVGLSRIAWRLVICIACSACDGTLAANGKVVTAPGPTQSRIYVDQPPSDTTGMRPLEGAIVTIVESPARRDSPWRGADTTLGNGVFSYSV